MLFTDNNKIFTVKEAIHNFFHPQKPASEPEQTGQNPSDSVSLGEEDIIIGKPPVFNDASGNNGETTSDNSIPLTLLHTNDIHGDYTNMPYLGTEINRIRNQNPAGTLLLDCGDMSFINKANLGAIKNFMYSVRNRLSPSMEYYDCMKYDAIGLGNHDYQWDSKIFGGYNGNPHKNRIDNVREFSGAASFPVLSANTDLKPGKIRTDNVKPYIIKELSGINVAVISVVVNDPSFKISGWVNKDPVETLNEYIPDLKKQGADLVVVMSHYSIADNKNIASKVKGIDVIIGAHDHVHTDKAVLCTDPDGRTVPLFEAGGYGEYLGQVSIKVDPANRKITYLSGKLNHIDNKGGIAPEPNVLALAQKWAKA